MNSAAPSSIHLPFITDEPGRRLRFESVFAARIYADAQPEAFLIYDAQSGALLETRWLAEHLLERDRPGLRLMRQEPVPRMEDVDEPWKPRSEEVTIASEALAIIVNVRVTAVANGGVHTPVFVIERRCAIRSWHLADRSPVRHIRQTTDQKIHKRLSAHLRPPEAPVSLLVCDNRERRLERHQVVDVIACPDLQSRAIRSGSRAQRCDREDTVTRAARESSVELLPSEWFTDLARNVQIDVHVENDGHSPLRYWGLGLRHSAACWKV
jgi:hypothetical protein